MAKSVITPYVDSLLAELDELELAFVGILEQSEIRYVNPNRPGAGVVFVGAADYGWAPSAPALEGARMALLSRLREWVPRFELLFQHPTPQVRKRHGMAIKHLERWLLRPSRSDRSIPRDISSAVAVMRKSVEYLRASRDLLPADDFAVRLVVDTNALLDQPDLAIYVPQLGRRYMAHVLPVVLRELDELKRGGRNEEVREAARRADRRLKGMRDNGDVRRGARVAGEVWAVFEHIEPRSPGLPSWLELDVPDDRFVASALLLQSRHPGSTVTVATSDLNLQTKLAAVALPFIEPAQ